MRLQPSQSSEFGPGALIKPAKPAWKQFWIFRSFFCCATQRIYAYALRAVFEAAQISAAPLRFSYSIVSLAGAE
jgi:hypothetical protein